MPKKQIIKLSQNSVDFGDEMLGLYLGVWDNTDGTTIPAPYSGDEFISIIEGVGESVNDIPWQETSDGHRKKVLYQNHNQTFTAGIWQSKGFNTSLMSFSYNEFIMIKQGKLICTDDLGVEHKINAGEALFIPQGVRCSWLAQGKITLHFVQIKLVNSPLPV